MDAEAEAATVGDRPAPPTVRQVDATRAHDVAAAFLSARTRTTDPIVRAAYQELERQSDQQYAALTDPDDPASVTVVCTRCREPYANAEELIDAVRATGVLEVTAAAADRDRLHPLLGCEPGGAYDRFRAVHDLVGHVATGFGFDRHGEYSAWLVQRAMFRGLARWAAATELHGENSVLWTTRQLAEHKAALLDPDLVRPLAPSPHVP